MSQALTGHLTKLALASKEAGTEFRVAELLNLVDPGIGPLGGISSIRKFLDEYELSATPDLDLGDFDTPRVLRPKSSPFDIEAEIERGEHSTQEFKSSLLFDRKRFAADPTTEAKSLRSEGVLHSSLKSIAAFLNTDGGCLYIGIADDHTTAGLDADFSLLPSGRKNFDGWQQEFRTVVLNRFHDGKIVLPYINICAVNRHSLTVARIQVTPRKTLTLLRDEKKVPHVYSRCGSSSDEIELTSMEEYILKRVR